MSFALRAAVTGATTLSIITILACILFAPMIVNEVNDIWRELDMEMLEFRVGTYHDCFCVRIFRKCPTTPGQK
jgi:hypothetical protein